MTTSGPNMKDDSDGVDSAPGIGISLDSDALTVLRMVPELSEERNSGRKLSHMYFKPRLIELDGG